MSFECFKDQHTPLTNSLVNLSLEQVPGLKGLARMAEHSHLAHLSSLEVREAAADCLADFVMPGAGIVLPKLVHYIKEKLANTDSSEERPPSALARLTVARAQNYYSHPHR